MPAARARRMMWVRGKMSHLRSHVCARVAACAISVRTAARLRRHYARIAALILSKGGAVYVKGGDVTFESCPFVDNKAVWSMCGDSCLLSRIADRHSHVCARVAACVISVRTAARLRRRHARMAAAAATIDRA